MMGLPSMVQVSCTRVVSVMHLLALMAHGAEDFVVRMSAGLSTPIVIGRGANGVIAVHGTDGRCEQIAGEQMCSSTLGTWIARGELYRRVLSAPGRVPR